MNDPARPRFQDRPQPLEGRFGCADHSVERALPGLLGCATEGRIDEIDPKRRQLGRQREGGIRVRRRAINDRRARFQSALEPLRPAHDRFDLHRGTDADEHDARTPCHLLGRVHCGGTTREHVRDRRPIAAAFQDCQGVALLADVLRDAVAHHAKADEPDCLPRLRAARHSTPPFLFPGALRAEILAVNRPRPASPAPGSPLHDRACRRYDRP